MDPLTESELRDSFVNCSRGEAKRLNLPGLEEVPWANLDYLGWRDPKAPQRAYVIVREPHGPVGLALRAQTKQRKSYIRSSMCSLCLTVHVASGVSMFVAPRPGAAGREGNTVGEYICADLRCSLYVRGILVSEAAGRMKETLDTDERILRLQLNLDQYLRSVTTPQA